MMTNLEKEEFVIDKAKSENISKHIGSLREHLEEVVKSVEDAQKYLQIRLELQQELAKKIVAAELEYDKLYKKYCVRNTEE